MFIYGIIPKEQNVCHLYRDYGNILVLEPDILPTRNNSGTKMNVLAFYEATVIFANSHLKYVSPHLISSLTSAFSSVSVMRWILFSYGVKSGTSNISSNLSIFFPEEKRTDTVVVKKELCQLFVLFPAQFKILILFSSFVFLAILSPRTSNIIFQMFGPLAIWKAVRNKIVMGWDNGGLAAITPIPFVSLKAVFLSFSLKNGLWFVFVLCNM